MASIIFILNHIGEKMKLNKENIDFITPSTDKKIRWISFQSLCGGMTLGAEAAFGCPPLCTIDFDGIDQANSSAYMNYIPNPPVF